MNVPNLITIGRFALVPVYIGVFAAGHPVGAFLVLLLAGATDVLDGYLARSRNQVTILGSMLDPLADKCMMLAVIVSLLATQRIPWIAALFLLMRDAGMIITSIIFRLRGFKTVPSNAWGKWTTALYYTAVLLIVFDFPYAVGFLWGIIVFSLITAAIYVIQFRRLNQRDEQLTATEKEHICR